MMGASYVKECRASGLVAAGGGGGEVVGFLILFDLTLYVFVVWHHTWLRD